MSLSYARGPERPLLDMTIDQAVRNTAERFSEHHRRGKLRGQCNSAQRSLSKIGKE